MRNSSISPTAEVSQPEKSAYSKSVQLENMQLISVTDETSHELGPLTDVSDAQLSNRLPIAVTEAVLHDARGSTDVSDSQPQKVQPISVTDEVFQELLDGFVMTGDLGFNLSDGEYRFSYNDSLRTITVFQ